MKKTLLTLVSLACLFVGVAFVAGAEPIWQSAVGGSINRLILA
jgi:hypothetical protein